MQEKYYFFTLEESHEYQTKDPDEKHPDWTDATGARLEHLHPGCPRGRAGARLTQPDLWQFGGGGGDGM
jgi:hypothetical protein